MSGLREIIDWVKRDFILDPEADVNDEFERISRRFEKDNRSALADILRDDSAEFLNFLGSRQAKLRDRTQRDTEIKALERSVEPLERSITSFLKGARNLLRRIFG